MTLKAYNENNEETILRYGYKAYGTIDDDHREFYLDLNGIVAATDQNGLSTKFPKSNENFYIIFGAKEAKYPVKIQLEVQAEYLENKLIFLRAILEASV